MNQKHILLFLFTILIAGCIAKKNSASDYHGKNIYVRAGSVDGNGTISNPFGSLEDAIKNSLPLDVIHVSEGRYNTDSSFRFSKDEIVVTGGYSKDFKKRDPFKYLTILTSSSKSIAEITNRNLFGFVIDGFIFDGQGKNSILLKAAGKGTKINNCLFTGSTETALVADSTGDYKFPLKVSNCIFVRLTGTAIRSVSKIPAIRVHTRYCIFSDIKGSAIDAGPIGRTYTYNSIFKNITGPAVINIKPDPEYITVSLFECKFDKNLQIFYKAKNVAGKIVTSNKVEDFNDLEKDPDFMIRTGKNNISENVKFQLPKSKLSITGLCKAASTQLPPRDPSKTFYGSFKMQKHMFYGPTPPAPVVKADTKPKLDGKPDDLVWKSAQEIKLNNFRFDSTWHPDAGSKIIYDDKGLYVLFRVKDKYIRCIADTYQGRTCKDSCVEFFFEPGANKGYFNFEINCGGTMLFGYRKPGGKYKLIPEKDAVNIKIAASMPRIIKKEIEKETEWYIELYIPFKSLQKFINFKIPTTGDKWRANLYNIATETSHPRWYSWGRLRGINFHEVEGFQVLVFE
ncbi:MAG: carbohydrate-binding family 9-like protein [Planctomycetota bacterium]|jgi:hypothetical protein